MCCVRHGNNGKIGAVMTEGNALWRTQGSAFLLEKNNPFWSLRLQNDASFLCGGNLPFPRKLRITLASFSSLD